MRDAGFLGIDPGVTGAMALLTPPGELLVLDMPAVCTSGSRREVSGPELLRLLIEMAPTFVLIEQQWPRPASGAWAAASMADSVAKITQSLVALKTPYDFISPNVWKKQFKLTGAKTCSIECARRHFPLCNDLWSRKKDHGRADAALIALAAARRMGFEPVGAVTPRYSPHL